MSEESKQNDQYFGLINIVPANYYDTEHWNPLHFKKKKGSKHEFGYELERVTPKAGEVRLLGNRNQQCNYY